MTVKSNENRRLSQKVPASVELIKGKATLPIMRYQGNRFTRVNEAVAVEEPLEIFLDGTPYYLTMRLPGEDIQLALGYCFSEGIIDSLGDVLFVHYCGEETGNRVEVTLDPEKKAAKRLKIKARHHPTYSSCGLCGKEMVEDICLKVQRRESTFAVSVSDIEEMIDAVENGQQIFRQTGATHAAALFDGEGRLLALSEDVGRHNAFDKVMGRLILADKIGEEKVAALTSRLSYEVVQKAARSGVEVLVGFSSATSLAVELANSVNLTLVGFARKGCGNIYTVEERILSAPGLSRRNCRKLELTNETK